MLRTDSEIDSKAGATLLTCLITSGKECPSLATLIPSILQSTMMKFKSSKGSTMRIRLHEVVMASLYYDAVLTISILSQDNSMMNMYFNALFGVLKEMDRDFTQRLIVLSFISVLNVPVAQLPEVLRNNMNSMLQQVIRELVLIEEQAAKEAEEDDDDEMGNDDDEEEEDGGDDDDELEEDDDNDDNDENDEEEDDEVTIRRAQRAAALAVPEGGYDEDADCLNAEDESYREVLESMDKEERVKRELFLAGEPVDDEDDDDFVFTSHIELMNVTQHFLDSMRNLAARDANVAGQLQSSLSAEDLKSLQDLIGIAAEKAAASAAESAI
jgi:hypothetical protein